MPHFCLLREIVVEQLQISLDQYGPLALIEFNRKHDSVPKPYTTHPIPSRILP